MPHPRYLVSEIGDLALGNISFHKINGSVFRFEVLHDRRHQGLLLDRSIARNIGLEGLEAEFMGEQEGARRAFAAEFPKTA